MSDIRSRRNSLLKSSLSINSIRNTVVNFTKGLVSSRETATEIVKKTNENNKFKRTLIGKDNSFFEKRRENARRRQREDELESSTVSGVTKRQGSVTSRSTKGFLGRILDFFGIILIGWFVNTLPKIIKSIQGLIDRIRNMVSVLTNFVDSVGDFLTGIRTGISNAIQKLPKLDLGQLKKQNEESLDSANSNLNRVRRDMISTVGVYNDPANAGLESYDEEQPLIFDEFGGDEKKDEKKKDESSDPTEDTVEGVGDDKNQKTYEKNKRGPKDSKKQENNDPNDQEFIKGINDQKEIKDIKSAESQSKGDTIEDKNEANKLDKDEIDKIQTQAAGIKNFLSGLGIGEGQQQADKQSTETESKKDNSSQVSGAIAKIRQIAGVNNKSIQGKEKEIKVASNQRPKRDNLNTGRNKNRSQVIIIEKGIPMGQSSAPSGGGGGGGSRLNSLDGLKDSEDMKKGIKKLQSIILST